MKMCKFCDVKIMDISTKAGWLDMTQNHALTEYGEVLYVNRDDKGPYIYGSGECVREIYYPKYCPECGNNLNEYPMKPTDDFVTNICNLYGEAYDDRDEEKVPIGKKSNHKSLKEFQRELKEQGIELSLSKIIKVLVSGGKYSTERSRQVQSIYQDYIDQGCPENEAALFTAGDMNVTTVTICKYLPYKKTSYNIENKSGNAKRCGKYRKRKGIGNG